MTSKHLSLHIDRETWDLLNAEVGPEDTFGTNDVVRRVLRDHVAKKRKKLKKSKK